MSNLNLDREHSALLAMDFHKRIVAASPMTADRNLVQNAQRALNAARAASLPLIHIVIRQRPAYTSPRNKFSSRIRERVPIGSPEEAADMMSIVPELAPVGDEAVVEKPRIGAFWGSPLEALLRSRDIHTLLLTGVATEFVVESTARYAVDADYRVIILEDGCGAFSYEAHAASISILGHMAEIASVSDLTESL